LNLVAKNLVIGVVTGSRADFGLLHGVLKGIQDSPKLDLRLFVTGMHLAPEFGETWRTIETEGFTINCKIDMHLSGDTPADITRSTGRGVIGFADAFEQIRPDLVLVLGDRFEILAAVQACLLTRIPVAHIAGGDTTEGAVDESIRHAITKMAHLHFVTNEQAAARVRQMGENPAHIYLTGSPGIDFIKTHPLLTREQLASIVGLPLTGRLLAVTFHPATLDLLPQDDQMRELLNALDTLDPAETSIIFTMSNADAEGRALMTLVTEYTRTRPHTRAFTSLGQTNYLSLMAHADAVVGNSSSGLYEAPTLKTPTVNIGDRQKGRLQAASVINCPSESSAIARAIHQAYQLDTRETVNPYGNGDASAKIVAILESLENPSSLLQKHFHPLP
jgi:UDP-hydrolysing UDP-N-acetyl-D-glucosamine 2-epimerase